MNKLFEMIKSCLGGLEATRFCAFMNSFCSVTNLRKQRQNLDTTTASFLSETLLNFDIAGERLKFCVRNYPFCGFNLPQVSNHFSD